jgi:hypothetical protein
MISYCIAVKKSTIQTTQQAISEEKSDHESPTDSHISKKVTISDNKSSKKNSLFFISERTFSTSSPISFCPGQRESNDSFGVDEHTSRSASGQHDTKNRVLFSDKHSEFLIRKYINNFFCI